MLTLTQVRALLLAPESERLERKSNLKHPERIRDTICAFANDLDSTREPGVLLIGADDQGRVLSDRIPDETLRALVDLRNDKDLVEAARRDAMGSAELASLRQHLKQQRGWP
jgi:ATP-dependent DNA helicase RecG